MRFPPYPRYKPSDVEWLGDVPEHWQVKRLDFLATVKARLGWKGLTADEYVPEGYIFLATPNIKGEEEIDFHNANYITAERYFESPEIMLREGDVLMAKDGSTLGITNVVRHLPAPATVNGSIAVVRPKGEVESNFLFRWLSGAYVQGVINSMKDGQGVPHLFQADIRKFSVLLPPRCEQNVISGFLDAETTKLDLLITKKRELIEKLKEKRTALISCTVMRGLPPEAARSAGLNPNPKLKPSGIEWLGDIPEHWHVLPFTKYVAEKSDYRGKTPEKVTDGVFLITARNVRMGFIDYESSKEYVAVEDYDEIMRRGIPKKGDILFTTEAPLGNVALVDREDIALAQRIIRFRMQPDFFVGEFTLYAMMSDYFQLQLQSLSTGSTAEGLKASKLPLLRLIAPPTPEQRAIAKYLDRGVRNIDRMITKVEQAIERLKEYRRALINAVVTGKIDVRDIPSIR